MNITSLLRNTIGVIILVLSLPSCDGLFSSIYDDAEIADRYGFIERDEANKSGVIYINAESYTKWIYIDLHTLTINDSIKITDDMIEPTDWDIAVHHYDTKTNNGSVIETGYTGISSFKNGGKIPEGTYVSDVWTENKIAIDMSGMVSGNIKYTKSYYNSELSKWLNVNTSSMPPIYTLSNKVYVIKLEDSTVAAIRLQNFMNASNTKGYMRIEYAYPLEF